MTAARKPVRAGRRGIAAAGIVAWTMSAWLTVVPPQASADCTGAGDFGAGSGCAPPGGGSSSAKAWPPTAVDWPPSPDSDKGGGTGDAEATPIVLPDGQKPSTTSSAAPTTSSTPIVPVGSP